MNAFGEPEFASEGEFLVNDQTVSPSGRFRTPRFFPEKGKVYVVSALATDVHVGGAPYNTVRHGWSSPVIIPAGESRKVELIRRGSAHAFAALKVW